MANRYMKSCSTSLIITKMKITAIMRYHLIPVRMTITKKTRNISEDVEKREPLCTVGRKVILCSQNRKKYGSSPKN